MILKSLKEMEAAAGRESGTVWSIIDVGGSKTHVIMSSLSQARYLIYISHSVPHGYLTLKMVYDIYRLDLIRISTNTILLLVDAIVFLAPLNAFDLVLAEDRSMNRLVRLKSHQETRAHDLFRKIACYCGNRFALISC